MDATLQIRGCLDRGPDQHYIIAMRLPGQNAWMTLQCSCGAAWTGSVWLCEHHYTTRGLWGQLHKQGYITTAWLPGPATWVTLHCSYEADWWCLAAGKSYPFVANDIFSLGGLLGRLPV